MSIALEINVGPNMLISEYILIMLFLQVYLYKLNMEE
jgi:hypothetical protein